MRIAAEKLSELTFGAVETVKENGGVTFYKCTQKQRDGWKMLSDTLYGRSLVSTGVRLDFHTNSRELAFRAVSGRKFDVLIDGVLTYSLRETDFDADCTSKNLSVGNGKDTRVTLVFPSHDVKTTLDYIELDDGAYAKAHRHACKILFMGDSITQGWNTEFDSMSYAWQTTLHFDADSVINGVGGGVFHECTFDTSVFDPDIVVVAYGSNDFGYYKTLDELRCHVRAYLDLVKKAYEDKKVFCISPIWRSDEMKDRSMGSFGDCRGVINEEILSHGFRLVDGYNIVPHFESFFADCLHPNDLGFCMYAKALIAQIEKNV